MRHLLWIIAILVLLIVNNALLGALIFSIVSPVALLGVVAAAVFAEDRPKAWFVSIVSGILLDFLSGLPDGVMLLSFVASAGLLMFLKSMYLRKEKGLWLFFAGSGLTSISFYCLVLVFDRLFAVIGLENGRINLQYYLGMNLVWFVLLNLAIAWPAFMYFRLIEFWTLKLPKTS